MRNIEVRYELTEREFKKWREKYMNATGSDEIEACGKFEELLNEVSENKLVDEYDLKFVLAESICNGCDRTIGNYWLYETNSKATIEDMQNTLDKALESCKDLEDVDFLKFSVSEYTE